MSKCGGWERASSCKHCHRLFHCVAPGNSWFKTTGIRLKSNETRWLRNCSTNSIANTSPFQAQNGFFFTNNATGKSDQRFCVVHFILSLSVRKNKKHLPRLWEFSKLNWEYKNTEKTLISVANESFLSWIENKKTLCQHYSNPLFERNEGHCWSIRVGITWTWRS